MGPPNPITVAVEGMKANSIDLTISRGRIETWNPPTNGHYEVFVDTPGIDKIFVNVMLKNGKKKMIQQSYFRVKCLPKPWASIMGVKWGEINQSALLVALALVFISNVGYCTPYKIISYTVAVFRGQSEIFSRKVTGPSIDSVTKNFFYTLKNNDRVVFQRHCDTGARMHLHRYRPYRTYSN